VEGRPLQVYQFGNGPSHRLIVADIHGGYEWNTAALADYLLGFLHNHPGIVPPGVTLYVLPSMNPDGLARSHGYDGRANADNVDLNRNFPLEWKATWAPEGCWDYLPITSGSHPLSEPESRALAQFVLGNGIEAMISYHSAALGIFAGGDPSTARSVSLAGALAAVSPYSYPPRNTGCEYAGEMVDWAAANGVAAVDIELSTHYDLDQDANLRVLYAFLNWQP
jgi:predicted deacylase